MTATKTVADTRFLLVFTFPSSDMERDKVRDLMHRSLRDHLIIPTAVLTEYVKTAGMKIGRESAVLRLSQLKENGAEFAPLDEKTAILAGELLLKKQNEPIGDAMIAATALVKGAKYVISDDAHFVDLGIKTRWM